MLRRMSAVAIGLVLISMLSWKSVASRDYAASVAYAAPTQNCNPKDNMDETAESFIGRCCRGSIKEVFPSEYLSRKLYEIQQACKEGSRQNCEDGDEPSLDSARKARTAWKLLSRNEYRK